MMRFDGTAARQLDLIDLDEHPTVVPRAREARPTQRLVRPTMTLLKEDVYAAVLRRRRRAQIAARHAVEQDS